MLILKPIKQNNNDFPKFLFTILGLVNHSFRSLYELNITIAPSIKLPEIHEHENLLFEFNK